MMEDISVLVTGASGFVAMRTIHDLLETDYRVRGSLRSIQKADNLREALRPLTPMADMLECVEADLLSERGWDNACDGMDYVLHMASPFPAHMPKNDNDVIRPAVEGTLNVLRAANRSGVKRVVLTSSVASILYGWGNSLPDMMDESHWSNPENLKDNTAYTRSKTLAEKAAWQFMKDEARDDLELSVVNPGLILGPIIGTERSTSLEIVSQLLTRQIPALPDLSFQIVDVRDVARAHIIAMRRPEAESQRFILADRACSLCEIAEILQAAFPDRASSIPTRPLPSWLVRLIAPLRPTLKQVLPDLGKRRNVSSEKMRTVLGIDPIHTEQSVKDTAQSLMDAGFV